MVLHAQHLAQAAAQDGAAAGAVGGDAVGTAREPDGQRIGMGVRRRGRGVTGCEPGHGAGDGRRRCASCRSARSRSRHRARRRSRSSSPNRSDHDIPIRRAGRRGTDARGGGDAGPLEAVILMPVLLLMFALVLAFGRAATAGTDVEHAARVGARAAAAAQSMGGAEQRAQVVVSESLADSGLACISREVGVGRFARARRTSERHRDLCGLDGGSVRVRTLARRSDPDRHGQRGRRSGPRWWRMSGRGRGERGNVSLFIVLLLPALFLAAGLVLDGGRQIQTRREAHGHAAAAARAAVQLSDAEVRARRPRRRIGGGRGRRPSSVGSARRGRHGYRVNRSRSR